MYVSRAELVPPVAGKIAVIVGLGLNQSRFLPTFPPCRMQIPHLLRQARLGKSSKP